MAGAKRIARLGILGAVVSVALVGVSACRDANKDGAAASSSAGVPAAPPAVAAGGDHSKEEFCTTMVKQFEEMTKFVSAANADRATYFARQKELNAKLVKTAPASLASDTARVTKTSDDANDAQTSRDAAKIKATAVALRSPEHLAAARRMNDYCGIKATGGS